MSDTPPGVTRREHDVRNVGDERIWVEWYVREDGHQSFTRIYVDDHAGEQRMLAADINELGQLAAALREARDNLREDRINSRRWMIRDLGAIERVWVETDASYATVVVEEVGDIDRMLVVDDRELNELTIAVEEAQSELPELRPGPHVDDPLTENS